MSSKLAKYLVLSLFFISGGCIEEIVMDPGERAVVVECIIDNEDKLQTVHLSYSASVSDNDCPKVEEADVRMRFVLDTHYTDFEDGHTVIIDTSGSYEFVKAADGVWQAEFEPIEYAQYTLEVEVPGYGTITAETVFPPKMAIDIVWSPSSGHAYSVYSYSNRKIWIYGLDYNPSTKQYEIADYIYSSDRYVDNFNLTEVTKDDIEDDIEEFRWPENLDMDTLLYGDPPRNPGCYLFLWGQDWTPYSLVMANSKSRIWQEDDAGILGIPPWPNDYGYNFHDRYLRWEYPGPECKGSILKKYWYVFSLDDKDELIKEKTVSRMWIAVNFKPYRHCVPHPLSRLVFDSVSEELDRYYKDVITFEQMQQQPFTDLTEL